MMRNDEAWEGRRVGGGEVTREGGDYLREVIYLKLSCKLGTLVSGERGRDFTVGVTIIQENITSLFFFNNIHRCLSCWIAYVNIQHCFMMIHCLNFCETKAARLAAPQILNCVSLLYLVSTQTKYLSIRLCATLSLFLWGIYNKREKKVYRTGHKPSL